MKKKILAICLAAVLVVLMVGCGGGSGNRLSGRWERTVAFGQQIAAFEFSGNRFTFTRHWSPLSGSTDLILEERGTFSISGNQIELVLESGNISVHSFSRTDNTIEIGGDRFYRAMDVSTNDSDS